MHYFQRFLLSSAIVLVMFVDPLSILWRRGHWRFLEHFMETHQPVGLHTNSRSVQAALKIPFLIEEYEIVSWIKRLPNSLNAQLVSFLYFRATVDNQLSCRIWTKNSRPLLSFAKAGKSAQSLQQIYVSSFARNYTIVFLMTVICIPEHWIIFNCYCEQTSKVTATTRHPPTQCLLRRWQWQQGKKKIVRLTNRLFFVKVEQSHNDEAALATR